MIKLKVAAGLVLTTLAASPALAGNYLRDSDGEVLSVMPAVKPFILPENPSNELKGVVYRMDTTGGPTMIPAPAEGVDTVKVGSTTYTVERQGATLLLRDTTTGARQKAVRVANGRSVNPTAFGLD